MSLEFEKKLAYELSELGIHVQPNFRVPGTDLKIDFYIKAPIRSLIEISGASFNKQMAKKGAERLENIYAQFNKSICLFIINFGTSPQHLQREYFSNLPIDSINFIVVPDKHKNPETYCALAIKKAFVHKLEYLKANEVGPRIKEKYEILDSLSIIQTDEENNKNWLYRDQEILKSYFDKLESSQKNIQASSSLSKRIINDLKVKIQDMEEDIEIRKHNIENLDKQHQIHKTRQADNLFEIESIQDQILDLSKEAKSLKFLEKETLDAIFESNKRKNVVSDDIAKPFKSKKGNIFTRKPLDEGMFGDVLSPFQAFLSPDKWRVLVKEVRSFEEEYESEHFTTAVLRIGRTLEYVIYTLVTSWGVKINHSSTSRIDKLNNSFEKLCKHLIYYYSPEKGQEKQQRDRLDGAFDELTKLLNQTQRDLDVEHEVFDTDSKINIESLLREVKAEYGSQEDTRNAIDNLSNSKLISNTLIKRNTAAHADHSGSKREFNEEDVKEMAEDLKKILFHLSNIHETISRTSS